MSHHGVYSEARFVKLYDYSRNTSYYRVLLVLALTMCPPLAAITLIDAIPLQDASKGWQANWVFWCRCALAVFAFTFISVIQFHVTAPAAYLSTSKCGVIAAIVAIGYSITIMAIASLWGFPIPFQLITCVPAWHIWLLVSMVLTLGRDNIAKNVELRRQTKRYVAMMQAQSPLLLFYPAYSAVFIRLSKENQTLFIFVLPVVKLILKNALAKASTGLGDFIPTIVISIDLFNAMYQTKSLQNSGSILTVLGIICIDIVQNMVSVWRLHHNVRGIYALQSQAGETKMTLDLLATLAESCSNPNLLEEEYWLSLQDANNPPSVDTNGQLSAQQRPGKHKIQPQNEQSRDNDNVAVAECNKSSGVPGRALNVVAPAIYRLDGDVKKARTDLHKCCLQLLHRTDFLLLVEYIECAIPLLVVIYIPILLQFENAKYYPDIANITVSKLKHVTATVFTYALLEMGTLLYVQWTIQRKFHFSALHQLAFVLEKDFLVVQASFMAWTMIIFQFSIAHFGEFLGCYRNM